MGKNMITTKVTDSGAEPYIVQKDVILCRSGVQYYHKSELEGFITEDNKPAKEREWYREYRPANVVVKAKNLCSSLPVTKEHPDVWVNSKNWKELAGGTTDKEVEVVALDGESEGEIGLKSTVTFYDEDLYKYYEDNNKEVSLGYTVKKHFVDNPDEVGYDIILDEITEVNHLAITKSGRGGSSVAVIDTLLGGIKPMRTGIFTWLASKRQKDSAPSSFGQKVFDALKNSKGTTEEELAKEMKGVLDSCSILKDCKEKETLINAVKDCFDHKEKALEEEKALTEQFDSMYVNISGDSLNEIISACQKLSSQTNTTLPTTDSEKTDEGKEDKTEDSEKTDEGKEDKTEDSEKPEGKEGETEDSEKTDEKDGCNKDSLPLDKEGVAKMIKDSITDILKPMVTEAVKECLGVKDNTKPEATGGVIDSVNSEVSNISTRDYTDFLEK